MATTSSHPTPRLLIALATAAMIGACARDSAVPTRPSGPVTVPMAAGPGGVMGGPGMRGRGPGMGGRGMMGATMQRHRLAMMQGVPAAYRGLRSPLPVDSRTIAAGQSLYRAHCVACHGEGGAGDGAAASGMWPPPADLRWVMRRPMATDGYLMWAIGDGGTALGTAMPAFKDALDETDRWRIIRYLRTL